MPKVTVDMDLCEYHGQCVFVAPKVFSFSDDDDLIYSEVVPEDQRAVVEKAAKACPQLAIKVE